MSRLRNRAGDERGAVFVFVAILMTVLIGSAALAVDIGQLTSARRDLQKVADAVALDSARAINGTSVATLMHPVTGAVILAAEASAARNNFPFNLLEVQVGTKSGTGPFVQMTAGSDIPTAVKIIARDTVDFAFAPGTSDTSREAVATPKATASFSVGSFLVSMSAGGNTVLTSIFGDAFDVNVLSYDGLIGATTTLEAIGLNWPLGVMTPDELLTTEVEAEDFFIASADALRGQGDVAAANVLDAMSQSITSPTNIMLGSVISASNTGPAAAQAEFNVLGLLTGLAFVADGTHALTIPAADLNIPGVGNVAVSATVIDPLVIALDKEVGYTAETAQTTLNVTPQISISTSATVNACSLTGTLNSLLSLNLSETLTCTLGGIVNRVLTLEMNAAVPISLEAAKAEATLSNITCQTPQSITLTPSLSTLKLNSNVDLTFTGTLLGNPLGNVLRVRGVGNVTTTSNPVPQVFLNPTEFGIKRTVGSTPLGLANLTNFDATDVTLLDADLGPVLSSLTTPVLNQVNSVLGQLDSILMGPLNDLLGLNVGGADLTALTGSLSCSGVKLVE